MRITAVFCAVSIGKVDMCDQGNNVVEGEIDSPATSFEISELTKALERLLASPLLPHQAKEALRDHELVIKVLGKQKEVKNVA